MDAAIAYKLANPSESLRKVAGRFEVSHVTLHDRLNNKHAPPGTLIPRNLSIIQEEALIAKINEYAARGTLLTPKHVGVFAQALCDHQLGVNWTTTFLRRHKDQVASKFYRVQEVARLRADTPENRIAFLTLAKETFDAGQYHPENVYNVDEVGFDLAGGRRTRRVAPRDAPIKSQAALPTDTHISVIATISTSDAPVPPFLIYPGKNLMSDWFKVRQDTPIQQAVVTDSGYINSYTMIQWLTECFDPYTVERANGHPRLLILDGHDCHTSVAFLDACWERNITCLVLPAHLSQVFQPLDVDFFRILKETYDDQIDTYQLGTDEHHIPKPFFYRWHQRAWLRTTTTHQIQTAWAKSYLFPLTRISVGLREARPVTPPPQTVPPTEPITPTTTTSLSALDRAIRRGEITPGKTSRKTRSGLEQLVAEKALHEKDEALRKASEQLDRAARGSKKRQRYPHGERFDQAYQESHAEELAERRETETAKREGRKRAAQSAKDTHTSKSGKECSAGPSRSV
ncbi:hypothetical protein TREMEDRAFT_28153 [Tremella mesenterica DSM 1558]|uniref:uncharacterized protein n=1 Tax=Tremella mesenterica (strain ATCC 24925 / CBS 8224 / DSM 1558 / NBRC 9311 / NRRL Y-6157 / RJB 2259-6 / UBC 559-6) TaxID=578456 RepID=UPI0003F492E2|nr:uncharacterized protein TREMEDRAFT_28153 [Tremella mesenterica DSM 1558]EIW71701.1 hypothetical protein TREMEDRAFT_28153 [Tremella mesenterica DSM 1558]